ncbi:tRNA threonylcarbamoyladenosine dehydratase [Anaerolentibacter hominis]|uniref:tRNA threonylcarbamoyladenosine dehydratase n=1 Tax=Anaerolentibacter hominis TaxID=3079009 RepID=UPI0031B83E71
MSQRFVRMKRLLGVPAMERLAVASVIVFGVGGVGSYVAEGLARGGVGRLILVDDDRIAESNINRQIHALSDTVGRMKTEVMKERILQINPEAEVVTCETFVLSDNAAPILDLGADYVVDALDTVTAKIAIATEAKKRSIPVISCMGTGNKLHPELLKIGDLFDTKVCPLCKVMRRELKKRGADSLKVLYSEEVPLTPIEFSEEEGKHGKRVTPGSVSFVPPVAGLMIAGEVIRELTGQN